MNDNIGHRALENDNIGHRALQAVDMLLSLEDDDMPLSLENDDMTLSLQDSFVSEKDSTNNSSNVMIKNKDNNDNIIINMDRNSNNSIKSNDNNNEHDDNDNNDTFSGCLLVMDDNHYLIEWIAYHYHVLPLRYLVIAIDPKSETQPNEILNRWTSKTDLKITVWHDNDYMTNHTLLEAEKTNIRDHFEKAYGHISSELVHHRARQQIFYYQCLKHMKVNNKHWTLLIDTDEFLHINRANTPATNKLFNNHSQKVPSIRKPGSVMSLLQQEFKQEAEHKIDDDPKIDNLITSSPCIPIPRLRYGAYENDNTKKRNIQKTNKMMMIQKMQKKDKIDQPKYQEKDYLNYTNFLTLRYRYHAAYELHKKNKLSKSMIDLSKVSLSQIQPLPSIHRPIQSICTKHGVNIKVTDKNIYMPFVINHYAGTYEQYTNRKNDARNYEKQATTYDKTKISNQRNLDEYNKMKEIRYSKSNNHDVIPWIDGFIQFHGINNATKLLHNVGVVDT